MASLEVIALDPTVPQLRAPGVSDTYHFCRYVEFQDGTSTDPSITNIGDLNTGIYWPNADELGFTTGGVEAIRINSGGNLGIGVVPNTWSVNKKAIQIARGAVLGSRTNELHFAFAVNDYVASDGIDRYIENGFATSYVQDNLGAHSWYVAPSGVANNAITFTRAMIIDSSGNVGVGLNNPTVRLDVSGDSSLNGAVVINEAGADKDTRIEGDTDTHLFFADASTDRIGIGTASPAFKLDVIGTGKVSALYLTDMTAGAGALYYNAGAENRLTLANYNVGGTIFFETNGGTYAGAIDASQNWGIGTTTPNVRLDVAGAMRLRGSTSGYVGLQAAAVAGTTTYTLPSADGSNGQVLTTNGTGTLSWTTNAGGDVTGPASASDNAIARFDGTTGKLIQNSAVFVDDDGDVGIGTSTPGEKLQIESGTPRIYMNATTNSASAGMYFRVKDGSGNADNSGIYLEPTANIANRYINFSASNIGSDMAIVAGGNVGIGTTVPARRLHVLAADGITNSLFSGATYALRTQSVIGVGTVLDAVAANESTYQPLVAGGSIFAFQTGGTERMRLDTSGNLGLGVTPSGWAASYNAFQFGAAGRASALFTNGANDLWQVSNAYFNGSNFIYYANGTATAYNQANGSHNWRTAASGTAGNTFTFTQAMTLNSSSQLGIGTTTVSDRLTLGGGRIKIEASPVSQFIGNDGSDTALQLAADFIKFQTGGSYTERARITSGGDLLVGTTSSAYTSSGRGVIEVNGSSQALYGFRTGGTARGYLLHEGTNLIVSNDQASGALTFQTVGTERARITSGGKFLIATTDDAFVGNLIVQQATSANEVITVFNSATSGDNVFIKFFTDNGIGRGQIDYNRAGGAVRYNTTSDYRAKDVYGLVQDSGEQIDALKVYRGKMHGATQERPMLIAHEAQEVVPYAVGGEKDAVDEDGAPKYQTMDHQILVPLLIAELQSLRKRVAELEAK